MSDETNEDAGTGQVDEQVGARPAAPDVVAAAETADAPDMPDIPLETGMPVETAARAANLEPADAPRQEPPAAPAEAQKKAKSGKGKKGKGGGGKKKAGLALGQPVADARGAGAPGETPGVFDVQPEIPPPPPWTAVGAPPGLAGAGGDPAADLGRGGLGSWLAANVLLLVVAVVAAVAAVGLVLSRVQVGNRDSVLGAQSSAMAAAKTYAVDIASYDYRHLDQDFGVVLAHSTASFRKSFEKSSNELRSALVKFHATAKATVVAAGVVSATSERAVVLVFLEQTVTNSAQKAPTTDRSQVELTVVRSGGTWQIDQIALL